MDQAEYIRKRRAKYMAQVLEAFELDIEPHVTNKGAVQSFKGLVRARFNALAVDCTDLMALNARAEQMNGAAQDVRDSLHPTGRP